MLKMTMRPDVRSFMPSEAESFALRSGPRLIDGYAKQHMAASSSEILRAIDPACWGPASKAKVLEWLKRMLSAGVPELRKLLLLVSCYLQGNSPNLLSGATRCTDLAGLFQGRG